MDGRLSPSVRRRRYTSAITLKSGKRRDCAYGDWTGRAPPGSVHTSGGTSQPPPDPTLCVGWFYPWWAYPEPSHPGLRTRPIFFHKNSPCNCCELPRKGVKSATEGPMSWEVKAKGLRFRCLWMVRDHLDARVPAVSLNCEGRLAQDVPPSRNFWEWVAPSLPCLRDETPKTLSPEPYKA